jgi:hypothetical protein
VATLAVEKRREDAFATRRKLVEDLRRDAMISLSEPKSKIVDEVFDEEKENEKVTALLRGKAVKKIF